MGNRPSKQNPKEQNRSESPEERTQGGTEAPPHALPLRDSLRALKGLEALTQPRGAP